MLADKNFRQWSSNRENYFSRNSPVHSAFIIIHPAPKPFPPTPFFAARDSHMHEFGGSLLCHSVVRSDHSLQAYCSAQYSFDSFPAKPLASCSYVELYLGGYVDSSSTSNHGVALPRRTRKYSQNEMGPWRL